MSCQTGWLLEGRVLCAAGASGRGPRVLAGAAAGLAATLLAATLLSAPRAAALAALVAGLAGGLVARPGVVPAPGLVATTGAGAAGLGDLGRGVLHARADLVD